MFYFADFTNTILQGLLVLGFWIVCWLLPAVFLLLLLDSTVGKRLRRQETSGLFLDLLDTILECGAPVEETLVSITDKRQLEPAAKFHLLGAKLRTGQRLSEALAEIPGLLPQKIVAMLRAGESIGDLRKVLPACRRLAGDKRSETRSDVQCFGWYGIITIFATIWMFIFISIMILPKFVEIFRGMVGELPAGLAFLRAYSQPLITLQLLALFGIVLMLLLHGEGHFMRKWFGPMVDWVASRTPWKRRRMQRDFSTLLAILLDARVPESDAVRLAADCAANRAFKRRAETVITNLQQGQCLTEAVQALDDDGEFRWRLTNAVHAQDGFLRALTGWCESLDARAFQQEQAAALTLTSALMLLNGLFVSLIVLTTFGALIAIVEIGVLW
jgi:type II secretory pathway component PulF